MFGKRKPADQPFDLEVALDRVLDAAERAGVAASMMAVALEQCAAGIRARLAVNLNLSVTPLMHDPVTLRPVR